MSTTPSTSDQCGPWSSQTASTGAAITAAYGPIVNCLTVSSGAVWVVITQGIDAKGDNAAVGVDRCSPGDTTCLDGRNDHLFSGFRWYSPPVVGQLKLMESSGNTLYINDGGIEQVGFDPTQENPTFAKSS
jgi:hypothetical protein